MLSLSIPHLPQPQMRHPRSCECSPSRPLVAVEGGERCCRALPHLVPDGKVARLARATTVGAAVAVVLQAVVALRPLPSRIGATRPVAVQLDRAEARARAAAGGRRTHQARQGCRGHRGRHHPIYGGFRCCAAALVISCAARGDRVCCDPPKRLRVIARRFAFQPRSPRGRGRGHNTATSRPRQQLDASSLAATTSAAPNLLGWQYGCR